MEREEFNFILQQVPRKKLASLCALIRTEEQVDIIRKPTSQTLLVPVHDPVANGTFYAGEVLVTSAIVQVNGVNGWAMVMDDEPELASLLATLDGAWAANIRRQDIAKLADEGRILFSSAEQKINRQVEGTRVHFDLL